MSKLSIEDILNSENKVALLDFSATWCAPCRTMSPIIDQLAQEYAEKADIQKIDIDEHNELAKQMRIQSVPTMVLFKDGLETKRLIGLQDKKTLRQNIEAALA